MRKIFLLETSVLTLSLSVLTGCFVTDKRRNYMVAGNFGGINRVNKDETCFLVLKKIGGEEYQKANGKNVIQDFVLKDYYSLDFYCVNSNGEKKTYDFLNLTDRFPNVKAQPVSYIDDNGYTFDPQTSGKYSDPIPGRCYYDIGIGYKNGHYKIVTYLYFTENQQ